MYVLHIDWKYFCIPFLALTIFLGATNQLSETILLESVIKMPKKVNAKAAAGRERKAQAAEEKKKKEAQALEQAEAQQWEKGSKKQGKKALADAEKKVYPS